VLLHTFLLIVSSFLFLEVIKINCNKNKIEKKNTLKKGKKQQKKKPQGK
jgi:hypothetical protein